MRTFYQETALLPPRQFPPLASTWPSVDSVDSVRQALPASPWPVLKDGLLGKGLSYCAEILLETLHVGRSEARCL